MNELSAEYVKAKELDRRIKTSAQLAQQSLYDMCMGFKEMRDSKLYKELGYQSFEEYCEQETGYSRRNVYRYISVVENLPEDFVTTLSQIGLNKLALLTKISESERTEIVESTDLEHTSFRDLESKIADLKAQNRRLMDKLDEEEDKVEAARKKEADACGKLSILQTDSEMYKEKIKQLEAEIKDLESRPIEVAATETSHEIENLRKAMHEVDRDWGLKYGQLEEQQLIERRELMQKHSAELAEVKADYEKKLADLPKSETVTDDKPAFKAYLANAIDAADRLCGFLGMHADSADITVFRTQTEKFIEMFKTKLEGI